MPQLGNTEMPIDSALAYIKRFREFGATSLTLLGGEPSLYDLKNKWKSLCQIIDSAESLGYSSIRLDTNGQFESSFLDAMAPYRKLEMSFSLDGDKRANDELRGLGVYERAVRNIKLAINCHNVSVTICVSRHNRETIENDVVTLISMGVGHLNFHPLLLVGNHQDAGIEDSRVSTSEWLETSRKLFEISNRNPEVIFRIPPRFVGEKDDSLGNNYCSLRSTDRAHVQPNGEIRVCPLSVGSALKTAVVTSSGKCRSLPQSELKNLGDRRCVIASLPELHLIPTCVSFKPSQNAEAANKVRKPSHEEN